MRLLIISIVGSVICLVAACDLYTGEHGNAHHQGPDAGTFLPDAYVLGDGSGSGCHNGSSDGGYYGDDGGVDPLPDAGSYVPDAATFFPDAH